MLTRLVRLRLPIPIFVSAFVLLYPLSYAPVVKYRLESVVTHRQTAATGPGHYCYLPITCLPITIRPPVYRPVQWLIDNTPLRTPLLLWADVWGMRFLMEC